MNGPQQYRKSSGALKSAEVKKTGSQMGYEVAEQKGTKKALKVGGIVAGSLALVAAALGIGYKMTHTQKVEAEKHVVAQQQTIANAADDFTMKANEFMGKGMIDDAIIFINKAESLEVGTQYGDFSSRLNKAKVLKTQYDEKLEKVRALYASGKYEAALKVLDEPNKCADDNCDKMIFSIKVLDKKMSDLGVIVSEHESLASEINSAIKDRDEKKALSSEVLASTKKLKDLEHKQSVNDATLDGAVDSMISIDYRVEPASENNGYVIRIVTKKGDVKKGDKMVLKDDKQKFLYHVAVKLENILPDRYFGPSQLSKLFQSGDLTSMKIEEKDGAYTLTFMGRDRKEIQHNIDSRFTVEMSGILDSVKNYKGAQK